MAIPSGSGTEVLKRAYIDAAGESEGTILTGVANHIMTVISIIVCENANLTDSQFDMYVDYNLGGTDLYLLRNQGVGSKGTFVWSDRFAITGTDKLHIEGSSVSGTSVFDVWCTYIDQDWS